MFNFAKLALASLTLGIGLSNVGYAAAAPPAPTTAPSSDALTCTMCQVTWVKTPVMNDKKRVIGYKWGKKDVCSSCMDAVTSFINTGKFEHTCKMCGDTMEKCETQAK